MLTRRSLLGSLVKSLLAAGVIAAPLATIVVPSEVEAEQTPESQPYLWGPSPSRWGRASTLSAPDGARASQATRRVAYAEEATLIYFGELCTCRRRSLNGKTVYQAKKSNCVRKSHATRTQSSITLLALSASTTTVAKALGIRTSHLGRNKAGSCTAAAAEIGRMLLVFDDSLAGHGPEPLGYDCPVWRRCSAVPICRLTRVSPISWPPPRAAGESR